MKRHLLLLSVLSVLTLSCERDNENPYDDDWLKLEASFPVDLRTQSAVLKGSIQAGKDYNGWEHGFCLKGSVKGSPAYDNASFQYYPVKGEGDITLELDGLTKGGHYEYYVYVKNGEHEEKSKSVEFYTYTDAGYEMEAVNLGNFRKWAVKNIGAASPEVPGSYFAWGEKYSKSEYSSANYKYTDSPYTLPRSADVASQVLGGRWRMPTQHDFDLLLSYCDWEYTTLNGALYGIVFKGRNSYKDNWIFFPFGGTYHDSELRDYNSAGYYYTSEARNSQYAYGLFVSYPLNPDNISPYIGISANCWRSNGYTIRAVQDI